MPGMNAENARASAQPVSPGEADDTIAAIATPPGVGGVGIVRISGPRGLHHRASAVSPGVQPLPADALPPSHLLTYGDIVDPATGETLDEVLTRSYARATHLHPRRCRRDSGRMAGR